MLYKIFYIIFLASTKFAISPMFAILQCKYNVFETIILTSIGGIAGVLIFAFLTKPIVITFNFIIDKTKINILFHKINLRFFSKKRQKNSFKKRNKRIIKIKQKYGLIGLAILTPILLSIPLGTMIAVKYYTLNKKTILSLTSSVVMWSVVLSLFVKFID